MEDGDQMGEKALLVLSVIYVLKKVVVRYGIVEILIPTLTVLIPFVCNDGRCGNVEILIPTYQILIPIR